MMADLLAFHLIEFERESFDDVLLLPIRHAVPKLGCLTEVVGETVTAGADFRPVHLFGVANEGVRRLRRLHRATASEAVRKIRDPTLVDHRPRHSVALVIVDWIKWPVDRELGEIRSYPAELGV